MQALTANVLNTIQREHLFEKGDTVLVALSGGADSVVLLHVLLELREILGLSHVGAMHVHHGLRGEFADRDERFVIDLCRRLNIPLACKHVDTQNEAKAHKESIEEAGRRLRYAFFEEQISLYQNAKIATAHTAGDQVETVLFRLLRGSGLKGVCGIPIKRGNIVRPLLSCSAQEVREYCRLREWDYMVDETNADVCYTRNRVRHMIVPMLKQINPQAEKAILRFSEIATEENWFMERMAQSLFDRVYVNEHCMLTAPMIHEDLALQRRVLCKWIPEISYARVRDVLDLLSSGGVVNISNDQSIVINDTYLTLVQHCRSDQFDFLSEQVVKIGEIVSFGSRVFLPTLLSYDEYCENAKIHKNLFDFCISYDMIKSDVCVRPRMQGDRVRPYGRHISKSLKKFLNEQHVPCEQRLQIPIVTCDDRVLLLPGLCVDQAAAVTHQTSQVLWFREL